MVLAELVTYGIKDANAVHDKMLDAFRTLKEKKITGYEGAAFGPTTEDRNTGRIFVEWDSWESNLAFGHGDDFMPFVQSFGDTIEVRGNPHVDFDVSPLAPGGPCSKRVVEIVECGFPANAVPPQAESLMKGNGDALKEAKPKGFGGFSYGWVREERDDEKVEGGKVKVLVAAIGWDSVEDHINATKAHHPALDAFHAKFMAEINATSISVYHFECTVA